MYVPEKEGSKLMTRNDGKKLNEYKIIDLFAGAGGLSNGFEQTGRFKVIGAVEINEAAVQTYIKNHRDNEKIIIRSKNDESDITKINFKHFLEKENVRGDEVVVIGGPPCQGFSNANRQKNYLISGNNQLVKQFVKAIDQIKPVAFLMENVKTMDSKIHKFFITKPNKSDEKDYGSLEHINEIMKTNGKDPSSLLNEDTVVLVETLHLELGAVFKEIISNTNDWERSFNPIIDNGILFSRLKSILRSSKINSNHQVNKQNEMREIQEIISLLKLALENASEFSYTIIDNAIDLLTKITDTRINSHEISRYLGPLIDLNQFLLHYRELLKEEIHLESELKVQEDNENKIKVIANVLSYNVVQYLKEVFSSLGYKTDTGVLTATDYGVPQRRKRFMILGIKSDKFDKETDVKLPGKLSGKINTTFEAIGDLEDVPPVSNINNDGHVLYDILPCNKENVLQAYYRKGNDSGIVLNHVNTESKELSLKRFEAIKVSNGKNFHSLADDLKTSYTDASRTQNTVYLRLDYNEPSPTVVNVRKSMWNHPKNAVALSIREAARLQSFKDNFIFCGTKDQQYQQVGNAVPPLMARAVAESLLNILGISPICSIKEELQVEKALVTKGN
jgi:DNA (cytosine-5)-methyltransferase 1